MDRRKSGKDIELETRDIYDSQRQLTGRIGHRGRPIAANDYHIIVHVCVFHPDGRLLIQQRHPHKRGWSNLWDVTAGGSALEGETSGQAAERELYEELGLSIPLVDKRPDLTINFEDGFDDYFITEASPELEDLTLQPSEVQDVRWATKDEVLHLIDERRFLPLKYSFVHLLFDLHRQPTIFDMR